MAWIVPLISIATDLLSRGQKDKADYASTQAGIEQQRLANASAIMQGGRAAGGYGQFVQPRPEQHDNGLGAALQLVGAFAGGGDKGSSSDNVGSSMSLLKGLGGMKGLGGQNGMHQSILSDYDPERDAKWKGTVTLASNRPALSDREMLGDEKLDLFGEPDGDSDDDSLTNTLVKRIRL